MPQREGHENSLLFVISLSLVFTICIALLRLWIRKSAYGVDDVVIGAATLVSLGHTGADYAAMSYGLGKTWPSILQQGDLARLNEASIAGIVLFFVALYLSKCAMLSFLTRITKTPSQIILYQSCNAVVGVLGFVSILVVTVGCHPKSGYYWAFSDNSDTCGSQAARWQAITGLDVATEILLLLLPIHLVWKLHMAKSKKLFITVAFWIRLPALGFSIGRNYYTLLLNHKETDVGLDSALVTIWLEVELAYAIGSSTLSALKSFTDNFATGFGLGFTRGKGEDSYGLSNVSGSTGNSSKTEKAKSASPSQSRTDNKSPESRKPPDLRVPPSAHVNNVAGDEPLRLRPEGAVAYASVSAEPYSPELWRANSSVGSDSSGDEMVILRETAYEVQHDQAPMLPSREMLA
ncbi:hypothetical protein M409DRAFT_16910 [Zasmidium cellare ATCC 36951]|uniref:Rhodopsin domain-containing protein n=1 Tax=Zasmidium cellare ATCC 36951 TaxID=1080233 RepID=A0A6A6D476_ZASCE|nr:uncharacterized protein M409DRAFT_16910 [Zasmidium cellare ATCC 36951]KAF2172959.1 hypothetical protein M409DRAFT_16910 [Zasmidium cellare ATCC 36951]